MPWDVKEDARCPAERPWGVVKQDDNELEGCHESEEAAREQQKALYANEDKDAEPPAEERVTKPPSEGIRASLTPGELEGRTLHGHFARWNEWTEIDSLAEGKFLERIVPGAFKQTIATKGPRGIRVLFQHGKDPQIGDQPIAEIRELREDGQGAYYEAELLDGIPPLVVDGLRRGLYGASFRFRVADQDWDPRPRGGPHNPDKLPERTIRSAELFEFGPVTWPAYAGATASLRSMTDEFGLKTLTADPDRLRQIINFLEPAAPAEGTGPGAHSEEGRDSPAEPPPPVAAPQPKDPPTGGSSHEEPTVEYVTREEKAARVTELRAEIAQLAVAYPGVLPPDAQNRWDMLTKEEQDLERDIAAWDERQALVRKIAQDQPTDKVERTYDPQPFNVVRKLDDIYDLSTIRSGSIEQRNQELRDRAMRSVETSTIPHPRADVDGARNAVAKLLDFHDTEDKWLAGHILQTGSPGYVKAFNRYFVTGQMEQRYAALTTGTTTTGGFATPWVLDPTIIATGAHTSTNPYRAACRVVQLVGTNKWEALTADAVLSAYAGEAVAVAEGGPTFAQPTYNCLKAHSFVTISYELLEDRPDITSEISVLIQESKDTLEESSFSVGAGTTVPWGVALLSEYTTVKTVGAGVVAIADIYAMEAALPIRHRMNAAWFMSRGTIRAIQGMETAYGVLFNSTGGYPGVGNPVRNLTGNTGLNLLGYPIWEAPSITSTLTTPDTNPIVFCDPKSYIIVDRVGLNVEIVPNIFEHAAGSRPTGQRGVYAHWRNTARRVNVDAGRILVIE